MVETDGRKGAKPEPEHFLQERFDSLKSPFLSNFIQNSCYEAPNIENIHIQMVHHYLRLQQNRYFIQANKVTKEIYITV